MKQITSYIQEGLRINKNTKIKHIEGGLDIQIKGTDEQYYHSIGKDQPIDDYAESPEDIDDEVELGRIEIIFEDELDPEYIDTAVISYQENE